MKIRTQQTLGMFFTFLLLFGILYVSLQYSVLGGIEDLELESNTKTLTGIRSLLINDAVRLLGSNKDWSNWDETYNYATNKNVEYVQNNLKQTTYENLGIDLLLILDTEGQVIVSGESETCTVDGVSMTSLIVDSGSFKAPAENWETSGFLSINGRLVEVAASTILTSDREGPTRGTLVFAHVLDDEEIVSFAISGEGSFRYVDATAIADGLPYASGVWLIPANADTFMGVVEIPLINDSEKGYIEATLPRPIYHEGQRLNIILLTTLVFIFLAITGISLYMTDRTLLSKIDGIGVELASLDPNKTLAHIKELQASELNAIVVSVNKLIDEIEAYKIKSREQERLVAMGQVASMWGMTSETHYKCSRQQAT